MGGFSGSAFPAGRILAQSAQAVSLTGSTDETTLASLTIPAGLIKTNGGILVYSHWSMTGNTNNKRKRIKLGSKSFLDLTTSGGTIVSYARELWIFARGRASQVAMGAGITGGAVGQQAVATATATEDLDTDLTLAITGQLGTGTDTLTLEAYSVQLFNP